jgi:hypothetical protein
MYALLYRSWGSSVAIETSADWKAAVLFPVGARVFFFSVLTGPQNPSIQSVLAAPSPGTKQAGCEADHSFPSSAEFMNGGAVPPAHIGLRGVVLN